MPETPRSNQRQNPRSPPSHTQTAGAVLISRRDKTTVTVTPTTASSLGAARDPGVNSKTRDVALPTGVSLQGVF
jgi:hypothetical protein